MRDEPSDPIWVTSGIEEDRQICRDGSARGGWRLWVEWDRGRWDA